MKDDTQPPSPDDLPDDVRDRMPDPSQPVMGIKPAEAMRYLGQLAEGQALAALLIAAACHGLTENADAEEHDADELRRHMKTVAAMLAMAGKITCKTGRDIEAAMKGSAKAFAAIGLKLDARCMSLEDMAEATGDGKALHKRANAFLNEKNGLAAGVICRADHQGARDLADRNGIDPDEITDQPIAFDVKAGKLKPPAPPADKPAKPTPPTWTGRNGSKWKADGSRDDSTPSN